MKSRWRRSLLPSADNPHAAHPQACRADACAIERRAAARSLTIRPLSPDIPSDLESTRSIYNHEVEHGVATFDIEPVDAAAWRALALRHNRNNHPLVVAECGGDVLGFACLSPYRDKDAFSPTVELSVYVHPDGRGRGIGAKLMGHLIRAAQSNGRTHRIVSVITGGNDASEQLHRRFGFEYRGTLHEVGCKFGRWLDINHWELDVSERLPLPR